MSDFRLPSLQQRVCVIGRTGSGKTRMGTWLLSRARFDKQPFVIIDYKREDLFDRVDRIREIGFSEIPKHPGLYVIRPTPSETDEKLMEQWLWKVWARERCGLYLDEGYQIPEKGAFQAILTQGRSKYLPLVCLIQRPSWISRFVFSEADFFSLFHLSDERDKKRIGEICPKEKIDLNNRLPDYHSYWYDVGKDKAMIMRPVPSDEFILEDINTKLRPVRKRI